MLSYFGNRIRASLNDALDIRLESKEAFTYDIVQDGTVLAAGTGQATGTDFISEVSFSKDGTYTFVVTYSSDGQTETFNIDYHSNLVKGIIDRAHRFLCNCCYEDCNECDGDDCCDVCEELLKTTSLLTGSLAYFAHTDIWQKDISEKTMSKLPTIYDYEDVHGYTNYPLVYVQGVICNAYMLIVRHILANSIYTWRDSSQQDNISPLTDTMMRVEELLECVRCDCSFDPQEYVVSFVLDDCFQCEFTANIELVMDDGTTIPMTVSSQSPPSDMYSFDRRVEGVNILSWSYSGCLPGYVLTNIRSDVAINAQTSTVYLLADCEWQPTTEPTSVIWMEDTSNNNQFCFCDAAFTLSLTSFGNPDGPGLPPPQGPCYNITHSTTINGNGSTSFDLITSNVCNNNLLYKLEISPISIAGNECSGCRTPQVTVSITDDTGTVVGTYTNSNWASTWHVGDFTEDQLSIINVNIDYIDTTGDPAACPCDCSVCQDVIPITSDYSFIYNNQCTCQVTFNVTYKIVQNGTTTYQTNQIIVDGNSSQMDTITLTYMSNEPVPTVEIDQVYLSYTSGTRMCGNAVIGSAQVSNNTVTAICIYRDDRVYSETFNIINGCTCPGAVDVLVTYLVTGHNGSDYFISQIYSVSSGSTITDTITLGYSGAQPDISIYSAEIQSSTLDNDCISSISFSGNNVNIDCCITFCAGGDESTDPDGSIVNNCNIDVQILSYQMKDTTTGTITTVSANDSTGYPTLVPANSTVTFSPKCSGVLGNSPHIVSGVTLATAGVSSCVEQCSQTIYLYCPSEGDPNPCPDSGGNGGGSPL